MNIGSKIFMAAVCTLVPGVLVYAQDAKPAEPDFKVTGSAQLRFRYQTDMQKINDKDTARTFYENKIGWTLGCEKKFSPNL